jgi:hypothetical protein
MGGYNISNAGTLGINSNIYLGNAALGPSSERVLLIENTFSATGIGAENTGIAVMATVEPDSHLNADQTVVGGDFHGSNTGAFNFPNVIGVRSGAMVEGSGVVENVSGVFVQNSQSAGTINEHYGIVILPPDTTGGSIVNNTALLIADQSEVSGNSFNLVSQGVDSLNIFEGAVAVQGKLALPVKDKATLQAYAPDMEGEVYYCSDCSPKKLVISTGTAAGNFAAADGGTFQ